MMELLEDSLIPGLTSGFLEMSSMGLPEETIVRFFKNKTPSRILEASIFDEPKKYPEQQVDQQVRQQESQVQPRVKVNLKEEERDGIIDLLVSSGVVNKDIATKDTLKSLDDEELLKLISISTKLKKESRRIQRSKLSLR